MENTYTYLLGFVSLKLFLTMLLFAALGIVVSLLIDSQKRNQNSSNTPRKFNWLFLLKDNWKTIALTAIIVILTIRFGTNFFPDQFKAGDLVDPSGVEKWLFGSLLIGLGFNQLIQVWKKRSDFLKVNRK